MRGVEPLPDPPLAARARVFPDRIALSDPDGRYRYRDLLEASGRVARRLLDAVGDRDLDGAPVAHLSPRGFPYVVHQWGVWRAGGTAVPLALSHPPRELGYVLDDADPRAILVHPDLRDRMAPLAEDRDGRLVADPAASEPATPAAAEESSRSASPTSPASPEPAASHETTSPRPVLDGDRPALMLYTSGTTGRPKGVVHTHGSLRAQIETLVRAWEWRDDDRIPLVLPLHHLHGIVNVLCCALWTGARCDALRSFDPREAWERIGDGRTSLFMAVPTIYHRLISAWEEADDATRTRWSRGARAMRLMVSGSAALPVPVLERWREITGHTLLERYGMTEIGMALSNPLHGERRPGHVGRPLPGVRIRLVGDDGEEGGSEGEIHVRGPGLFREYWRRPDATDEAFTDDGWFRTGDLARIEDGHYRILGRRSVDILKSGGYKISALEVESVLRGHPAVGACAVVGVPDPEWGERVAAALVPREGALPSDGEPLPDAQHFRAWAKERLAPYKAPTLVRWVDSLPRNAMGKVRKPRVRELF